MPRIQHSTETHDMGNNNPRCPLCGQPANIYRAKRHPQPFEGYCEVCGDVCITLNAIERAADKKYLISAWLRQRPASEFSQMLVEAHIERILKDTPLLSVPEKLDRTLSVISELARVPGQAAAFKGGRDYPLIYAKQPEEAYFYLQELAKLGYLQHQPPGEPKLSAVGYQRLEEIQRTSRESALAFVAMWFDRSLDQVFDSAIEPTIRESGYKAIRIDRQQHANRIDDEIIGRIKGSRFMVADFTGQRAGVYFEAGFMLGLRRTVIWMCRKSDLPQLHFDTRQYNFIDYERTDEAKTRLYDRIIALEGEGPETSNRKA